MSKRLMTALQTFADDIYERKQAMLIDQTGTDIIEDYEDRAIAEKTSKLLNFLSTDMDKAFIVIGSQLNKYEGEFLEAQRSGKSVDEEKIHDRDLLVLQQKILEKTIERKREIRRNRGDSPVISKHVEYPLFNIDSPRRTTIEKMRNEQGLIVENRDGGYRQMYFKNSNGTLLTEHDSRVLIALGKICMDKGLQQEFRVEIREIAEAMKLPLPSGGDYDAIRKSLDDIWNTSIVFEEAMDEEFDHKTSVDYHRIVQRFRKIGRNFSSVEIKLQDYFYEALCSGDFFMINMYLLNDLSLTVSKSLYKFILNDLRISKKVYAYEFETLRHHLGYGDDNGSRAFQTLKKAFQQMKEFEVIQDFSTEKIERGNYIFYVKPHPTQVALNPSKDEAAVAIATEATHEQLKMQI